jgi:hypothetical protein
MKIPILNCIAVVLLFTSCNKTIDHLIEDQFHSENSTEKFSVYTIPKGQHFANNSLYKPVELSELQFAVKLDSSAIYESVEKINQYDINKLYGFSDNNSDHHQYSARFGWSWTENALRLYAYVYNEGKVSKTELGTVAIGEEVTCSIQVAGDHYVFTMNDAQLNVPRSSSTPLAKGYMLYPYFGGDETAPHDVRIWIKNL